MKASWPTSGYSWSKFSWDAWPCAEWHHLGLPRFGVSSECICCFLPICLISSWFKTHCSLQTVMLVFLWDFEEWLEIATMLFLCWCLQAHHGRVCSTTLMATIFSSLCWVCLSCSPCPRCVYICMCVCACVRKREREREGGYGSVYKLENVNFLGSLLFGKSFPFVLHV